MSRDHQEVTGARVDASELAALAATGHAAAAATLARYHSRMARALASIINVVDPHAIVLGGGLSNISSLYEHVPRLWERFVFSDRVITQLLPARYGDASGVRGAAWLTVDKELNAGS